MGSGAILHFWKEKNVLFLPHIKPLHFSPWPGQCSLFMKYGLYRTIQLPWGLRLNCAEQYSYHEDWDRIVQNNSYHGDRDWTVQNNTVTMGTETELYRTTQLPWGPRPNCTEQHSYHGDRDWIVQNNSYHGDRDGIVQNNTVTMGTKTELYRTTQLPWGPRLNCTEQYSYHGDRDWIVQNNTVTMGTETELYRTTIVPWGPRLNCTEQHSYHGDRYWIVQNNTVTMGTETNCTEQHSYHGDRDWIVQNNTVTIGTETELYRTTQLPWGPRLNCTEQHSYHGDWDWIVQNNTVTMGTETELYRTIQLPWEPRLNCTDRSYHGDRDWIVQNNSYHGDLYWSICNLNIKTFISNSSVFLSVCATEWYYKHTDLRQKILRIHLNTLTSGQLQLPQVKFWWTLASECALQLSCELTKNEPPNLIITVGYSRLHNLSCVKPIKPSHKQIKM